jgi:hypothetical protein
MATRTSTFLEYIKLHLISLNQDLDAHGFATDELSNLRYHNILGQIKATEHLLSVATDIMNASNERYE